MIMGYLEFNTGNPSRKQSCEVCCIFPLKTDKSVKGFKSSQKVLHKTSQHCLLAVNSLDFQETTIDIRWTRFEA